MNVGRVLLLSAGNRLIVKAGRALESPTFVVCWHVRPDVPLLARVESLIHLSEVRFDTDTGALGIVASLLPLYLCGRVTLCNASIGVAIALVRCASHATFLSEVRSDRVCVEGLHGKLVGHCRVHLVCIRWGDGFGREIDDVGNSFVD